MIKTSTWQKLKTRNFLNGNTPQNKSSNNNFKSKRQSEIGCILQTNSVFLNLYIYNFVIEDFHFPLTPGRFDEHV